MIKRSIYYNLIIIIVMFSCNNSVKNKKPMNTTYEKGQYGYDLQFLQKHLKPIELKSGEASVLISPEYQGRVMTSSASGMNGFSFGWINRDLIESGKVQPHIMAYGGEERIWFGPEGGQFSIFFPKGTKFDMEHWQTPSCIDTEPFDTDSNDSASAVFSKKIKLTNYSGNQFDFEVTRKISLLNDEKIAAKLNMEFPVGVKMVAYETDNSVKNTGNTAWTKETGALSIWLLGMMNPSPEVTVVIPYKKGDLGTVVKDDYFGKVPAERLIITDDAIFFKADGNLRSKIGVSPKRALPVIGSYDAVNNILTILECSIDATATDYVNSAWELQKEPFAGDVINSYNDGPVADGSQMGPFYELESSSKAGFLKPGEILNHIQCTFHFEGDEVGLSKIAKATLGVTIEQINAIFSN
jgi:hypothetical protein